MENNELKVVPLVAYESMLAREDKTDLTERQIQNRMYKAEDTLFLHL